MTYLEYVKKMSVGSEESTVCFTSERGGACHSSQFLLRCSSGAGNWSSIDSSGCSDLMPLALVHRSYSLM